MVWHTWAVAFQHLTSPCHRGSDPDHPIFGRAVARPAGRHTESYEGTRSRIQVFQGVVIRRHGAGVGETFTVRKVSFGVGVERTFPVHTPIIEKIEVVTRGDVRRAKLYYLRDLRGKAAKIKEKRDTHGKFEAKNGA